MPSSSNNLALNPNVLLFDAATGKLTRDGFLLIQSLTRAINSATSDFVLIDAVQTLTNKTMDGDANTFTDIPTSALATRTGIGGRVATASAAGTDGRLAIWNATGDLDPSIDPDDYTPTAGLVALLIEDAITNGTVDKAPTSNAVFDALALYTATSGLVALLIEDAITNGTTAKAPTSNAVFDALALKQTAGEIVTLKSYVVAGVPSATPAGQMIYVSNESGGAVPAFSNGTNWLRVTDRTIIS